MGKEEMEMSRRRRSEMDTVVLRCLGREKSRDDGVLGTGKHVRFLGFWFRF